MFIRCFHSPMISPCQRPICPSKYRDDHQRRCEQCWRHSFHHWMWCFLYLTGWEATWIYMIPVVGECSKIKLQRKTTNGFISSTGFEEPVQCCTGLQWVTDQLGGAMSTSTLLKAMPTWSRYGFGTFLSKGPRRRNMYCNWKAIELYQVVELVVQLLG